MENKKEDKFKFVTLDENGEIVEDDSFLKEIKSEKDMSFKEIQEKEFETKSLKELVDASLQKPRRVPSPAELDRTKDFKNKMYVSFETRVAIRIIIILALFASACYFILEAINFGKKDIVTYNEITEANYTVCPHNNSFVDNKCLAEGLKYNQDTAKFINVLFKYNLDYSKSIPYDIAYHIVAITKIFDKENNTKVLFKNEDVLVERTSISDISDRIFFYNNINLDYNHYNTLVKENEKKYGDNSEADLEVVLYLDTDNNTSNVASITVPLNEKNFSIRKSALNNLNKSMELDNNTWNDYNSMCAVVATILIIISLIILYRTTKLVLKVTNNRSEYEKTLNKILKDYDKDIVTAKDGYAVETYKKIIKVAEFSELLDARHLLNKPIIYSKINSVKSEFVVEDDAKAFKYVLKDSDL
ncbi:MAG: hypothetical protein IJG97_04555 [Bacilli bacterium]|nr:hypothetical protein [Bacilli bacterium]